MPSEPMTEREAIQELAQMLDDMTCILIAEFDPGGTASEVVEANPTIQMFRAWQDRCQVIIRAMGHDQPTVRPAPVNPRIPAAGVQA